MRNSISGFGRARALGCVTILVQLVASGCSSTDTPESSRGGSAGIAMAGSGGANPAGASGAGGASGASSSGGAGSGGSSGGSGAGGGATGAGGNAGAGGTGAAGSGGGTVDAGGGPAGAGGKAGTGGNAGSSGSAGGSGSGGSSGSAGSSGRAGSGGSADGGDGGRPRFSFFVTSLAALRRMSGSQEGFGGDLSYGETGEGAGLRGADKICTEIAESSMPGSGAKTWRAFLSAPTGGPNGGPVNAIDRIGPGPWHDRVGRLFSASKANLNGFRPVDSEAIIKNDFPNEHGVPNHNPDGTGVVDNHDTLTGSAADGTLYTGTPNPTCTGWTSKVGAAGKPRVGHSWPRKAGGTCPGTAGCYGHWMSSLDEAGCAPGVNLIEMGGPNPAIPTVGSGGGYGGFYCFALTP